MIPLDDKDKFFEYCLGNPPYEYQSKFLHDDSKRKAWRAGRKVGKTTTVAIDALYQALKLDKQEILIVSPFQRQSNIPFEAIKDIIESNPEIKAKIGSVYSATKVYFENGSKIFSLPAGRDAKSIRGYSPNRLIIDEAAFVPDKAWISLEPSLFQTGGDLILISTPQSQIGRFYEAFHPESGFSTYHVPSHDCPGISKENLEELRKKMLKGDWTEADYKREVLGEFIEEGQNYFPIKLITECIYKNEVEGREINYPETGARYRLSVDFARYGEDETVYMIGEVIGNRVHIVKINATKKKPTTDAMAKIREFHHIWGFDLIYLDESGLGGGIVDILLEEGLPVVPCPFNFKAKWEYYRTLKIMMENDRMKFYRHPKLIKQLESLVVSYKSWGGALSVPHGKHDDYPDALALLCKDMAGQLEEEEDGGFIL